jgi:hypothetical protein
MSTIDILFIVCVVVFCFYGIYLGYKIMYDIRQRNIDLFNKRRNEIRKGFEHGK